MMKPRTNSDNLEVAAEEDENQSPAEIFIPNGPPPWLEFEAPVLKDVEEDTSGNAFDQPALPRSQD
jgi:hypothetical protein